MGIEFKKPSANYARLLEKVHFKSCWLVCWGRDRELIQPWLTSEYPDEELSLKDWG